MSVGRSYPALPDPSPRIAAEVRTETWSTVGACTRGVCCCAGCRGLMGSGLTPACPSLREGGGPGDSQGGLRVCVQGGCRGGIGCGRHQHCAASLGHARLGHAVPVAQRLQFDLPLCRLAVGVGTPVAGRARAGLLAQLPAGHGLGGPPSALPLEMCWHGCAANHAQRLGAACAPRRNWRASRVGLPQK